MFKGVYDADSVPHIGRTWTAPLALVVNTKKDTSKDVGHWIAIVITADGKGHYFDSLGKPPVFSHWLKLLKSFSNSISINRQKVQRDYTNSCGYIVIDYIMKRILLDDVYTDQDITDSMNEADICRKYTFLNDLDKRLA